jgi:Enolase C-terminal domain-like
VGWPVPVRDRVPVNVTVPVAGPERAHEIAARSGCTTAKVKVADHPGSLAEDLARVEAVRAALGPAGSIRVDANGRWDVDTAVTAVEQLDATAGGLEYVEQPCATVEELAAVRRRVDVRIAADESIRRAGGPEGVALAGGADIAVIKCTPLGGVRRALRIAESTGLPCVVPSALGTSSPWPAPCRSWTSPAGSGRRPCSTATPSPRTTPSGPWTATSPSRARRPPRTPPCSPATGPPAPPGAPGGTSRWRGRAAPSGRARRGRRCAATVGNA